MRRNQPLNILVLGLAMIGFIFIAAQPTVQSNLVNVLFDKKPPSQVLGENLEKVSVDRTIDGDTIVLSNGKTVRYLNMDTPETKKPSTPVQCFGPDASDYNKKLVTGKTVYLKYDKEKEDRYGRDLRFVFLNEEDADDIEKSVNAMLIKNGFARSISYKPNVTYKKQFDLLEKQAKENKIGLWSKCSRPFEE